jgi:hypothetical protein
LICISSKVKKKKKKFEHLKIRIADRGRGEEGRGYRWQALYHITSRYGNREEGTDFQQNVQITQFLSEQIGPIL